MNIKVPENVGSDALRMLPVTKPLYTAQLADIFLGKSGTGNPKVTIKFTVTSEYEGPEAKEKGFEPTLGATIIDTYSLQEQAIWRLNDLYKKVTGERIPAGESSEEAFLAMLKKALVGTNFNLLMKVGKTNKGDERMEIEKMEVLEKKSKLGGGRGKR